MIRYTELKNIGRRNLREVLPLAKPFTVLIEPSSLCNFRCIQCFQSLKRASYFTRNRMHMPLERFRRAIEQLRTWPGEKLKVLKLSLYGEPLLTPDFPEMLRLARKAEIADRIEVTTNASLLSPEIADAMVRYKLDYLRVSIYAATPERQREITHSAFSPEQIHENLRMLREVKRRFGSEQPFVSPKMLDAYGEENERFMTLFRDVADELYLDKPHGWIGTEEADFMERYYGDDGMAAVGKDLAGTVTGQYACPMAFTTMAVRSNGDVSPCCVDFIGGTNLGNIDEASLPEIWNSRNWFEFQKMQLEKRKEENSSCRRCYVCHSSYYTRDNIDGFPVEQLLAADKGEI